MATRRLFTLDSHAAGLASKARPGGHGWAAAAAELAVPVDSNQVSTEVAMAYGLDEDCSS